MDESATFEGDVQSAPPEQIDQSPRRLAYNRAKMILHQRDIPLQGRWNEPITNPNDNPFKRYDAFSRGYYTDGVASRMIIDALDIAPQSEVPNELLDLYVETVWEEPNRQWPIVKMLLDVKAGRFIRPTKYDNEFIQRLFQEVYEGVDPHKPDLTEKAWSIASTMVTNGNDVIHVEPNSQSDFNTQWKEKEKASFKKYANSVFAYANIVGTDRVDNVDFKQQLSEIKRRLDQNPDEFAELRALLIKREEELT